MGFKKYVTALCVNKNDIPYQFKQTRTLQMSLGCWILGKFPIIFFPNFVQVFEGSLEMLPPLILVTIFLSIPMTFFTLGISQYSKKGWFKLWDASPVWKGIGITGMICLYISTLYSASFCTYFLYYTVRSLEAKTPWLECGEQDFLVEGCFTFVENRSIRLDCIEMHDEEHCEDITWKNSALYFLDNTVKAKKREGSFFFNHELIPYQAAMLVMVYICLRSSTAGLAIFSPFMLTIPTLLHVVLLIRSFLHPGTLRALEFICQFKSKNFLDIHFWFEVGTVSLYGTGFAYGGMSNFGMQYNFRHPINVDAVFINLATLTYSILYIVFLYNMCGIVSYESNIPIDIIIGIDDDLNFIQTPLSFNHLSMTKFWTFIFFLSNFFVMLRGLATQCEMFLSMLYEFKPKLKSYTIPCALTFCFTHLFWNCLTNFGMFHDLIFELEGIISYNVFPALAFYLYIFLDFFYGVTHFVDDMHFMLGFRPSNIWRLNWYIGFLINLGLLIYSIFAFDQDLNESLYYVIIISTVVLCLLPLIYFIIFVSVKCKKNVTWTELFKSTKEWGPRDEVLRKSRDMFSAHDMTKEYLYRQQRLKFKVTDTSTSRINASLNVNM